MVSRVSLWATLAVIVFAAPASSQFVREGDVNSIAGVIGGASPPEAVYTFTSAGGEILFASLDGEVYAVASHEGEGDITPAAEGGGCSEDEGGPARFCLQVIDPALNVLCASTRPAPPPGWQRDPRFACVLPPTGARVTYRLRVSAAVEGACTLPSISVPTATEYPFLLNYSLRSIAPSGTSLPRATAASKNHF